MKTFTKAKIENKARQCNAQFPCLNWELWLDAHWFKAFFQLAYGLITTNQVGVCFVFLKYTEIPKSICKGRKKQLQASSMQEEKKAFKENIPDTDKQLQEKNKTTTTTTTQKKKHLI